MVSLYPPLSRLIEQFATEVDLISPDRRRLLDELAAYIRGALETQASVQLHFICTHNSRRSQLAQVWATALAAYLGMDGLQAYSGGTEVTAFNPRAIAALARVGFRIDRPGGENPHYRIHFAAEHPPLVCFSKTVDHPGNPTTAYAAVMTCSDADQNCPYLPQAALRLPLTYEDPKVADDTPLESVRYDERTRQIGRELFYMFDRLTV